jgi:ferredoxin
MHSKSSEIKRLSNKFSSHHFKARRYGEIAGKDAVRSDGFNVLFVGEREGIRHPLKCD